MKSLTPEDVRRWPLAEKIYADHGAPSREELSRLAVAMKEIIERCYLAVIYKRYKQVERKEWPEKVTPNTPVATPQPTEAQIIARARNLYPPEQFTRWLAIHEAAKEIDSPQPQSVIPIEKGRKAHG